MAARPWAKLAVILTSFVLAGAFGAPTASAGDGDCIAKLFVPDTGAHLNVAFDGTYLYYSNFGEDALHRTIPPGTSTGTDATGCSTYAAADIEVAPIVGLVGGVQVLSYDAVSSDVAGGPVFWAVGEGGRTVYKLFWEESADPLVPDTVTAILQFVIPDTSLPEGCKLTNTPVGFCPPEVDGLAFDAVSDLLWYSPEGTHRIYAFETAGTACDNVAVECPENLPVPVPVGTGIAVTAGWFDVDDTAPMAPDCPNVNSGIAVGGPATDSTGGDEIIAYLFSNECRNWFRYKGNTDDMPVKQQVYPTFSGVSAEDAECDSETFGKPVVWVRDFIDFHQFHAYEVATCNTGGGLAPAPDTARMTGGGHIPAVDPLTGLPNGKEAHHGTTLRCNGYDEPNQLQVSSNGSVFHMRQIVPGSVNCRPELLDPDNQTIRGQGRGRWNEHMCRKPNFDCAEVRFEFTDRGEPGTLDTGRIEIYYNGVLVFKAAGALLTGNEPGGGNYRYHPGR